MLMSDIRRLDDEQLKLEADSLRRKLFEMRSQKATAKVEDTSVVRQTRRDLARVQTEQTVRRARPLTEAD
ncbi:MAG: 50S ribosomal protein L29 [Phycisphaerae bacterium]|nr:50S ribosomal protein L29 [Phycisphaerae bacterium]